MRVLFHSPRGRRTAQTMTTRIARMFYTVNPRSTSIPAYERGDITHWTRLIRSSIPKYLSGSILVTLSFCIGRQRQIVVLSGATATLSSCHLERVVNVKLSDR